MFASDSGTSTIAVEWELTKLLHNPSTMAKVHAELAEAFSNKTELNESDILKLPYLQAVIKEVFRLHPPAPFLLPRKSETNIELCGDNIPKNTLVLVNAWAIGRNENVWKDADVLMPERFLELERDVVNKGRDFELIPFGARRRFCPGLPRTFRMVHLILASLLHKLEWKLSDGMRAADVDLSEKFGVTLAFATPIHAVPFPIQ